MASLTLNPERRQTPRTIVNRLAYINLDSNNGAIVLNVSFRGLCFHSVAPIQRSETIRFWFSDDKRRIEVDGQLAWMDEKQKTAGLRFTNLSTEARLQIRNWMSQPVTPATAGAKLAPPVVLPPELPVLNVRRPDKDAVSDSSTPLEVRSSNIRVPALLRGFSAGLIFGILVSTLVAGAFLLHAYRREFANSLVQLGERLGARSEAQTVSPAPETISPAPASSPSRVKLSTEPQTRAVNPQPVKAVSPVPISPAPASNPSRVKLPTQPQTRAVNPQPVKAVSPPPVTATRAPNTAANATNTAPVLSSVPPPASSPKTALEPGASDIPRKIDTAPKIESANHPSDHIEDSRAVVTRSYLTTYLEVGKFHELTWADQTTNKLNQLGFRATVVHKGLLWINSYQVLVGPYSTDDEAKAAHKDLVSHGFSPRGYERGSRSFWFPPGLTLHGAQIPVEDCDISWESYVTDAIVKFEKEGNVVATAEGKWVRRGVTYQQNALVYQKNGDGSHTLLEIRFRGMSRALVFGEPS